MAINDDALITITQVIRTPIKEETVNAEIKKGAFPCYCAYVLRFSRYSGFLWVVLTNTGNILVRLRTMRKRLNLASALGIQQENLG